MTLEDIQIILQMKHCWKKVRYFMFFRKINNVKVYFLFDLLFLGKTIISFDIKLN